MVQVAQVEEQKDGPEGGIDRESPSAEVLWRKPPFLGGGSTPEDGASTRGIRNSPGAGGLIPARR